MRSNLIENGRVGFLLIILMLPLLSYGQSISRRNRASMIPATSNTAFVDPVKKKKSTGKNNIRYIYKTDPQRLLIGNRCVEEYTRSMGFVYVVVVPNANGDADMNHFFHNMGTSLLLTFTKGPFWSRKVRKRIEKCRMSSGDFVG